MLYEVITEVLFQMLETQFRVGRVALHLVVNRFKIRHGAVIKFKKGKRGIHLGDAFLHVVVRILAVVHREGVIGQGAVYFFQGGRGRVNMGLQVFGV